MSSSPVDQMMDALTTEEKELAARSSSYKYLVQSTTRGDHTHRERHAEEMAQRYFDSKKDVKIALQKLRETLAFRKALDLASYQLCIDSHCREEDNTRHRERLFEDLSQRCIYVQGFDKAGRALWIGIPRATRNHDPTSTILSACFTMDKAIACSETRGHNQITAILHYEGIDTMAHKQPLSVARQVLSTLRSHYIGRVHRIYLVDAPWSLRTIWKILKPFAGKGTRRKVVFVTGDAEKKLVLGPVVDDRHATSWMLPTGQRSSEDFDLHQYLNQTPFNEA